MDPQRLYQLSPSSTYAALRGICAALLVVLACACSTVTDSSTRSVNTILNDDQIESVALRMIKESDPRFAACHVVVVSHKGVVLLAGEVTDEGLKQKAGEVVLKLDLVKSVHNELEIGSPTAWSTRSNDAWITTKVKGAMLAHGGIDVGTINVTTENGVVFLMGNVTHSVADATVEAASTVSGVRKIVKVFDYSD
jgi:osmotically-inducible protein OsmY